MSVDTAPQTGQQSEAREAVEAGALMVLMAACLGGLGIVLAAIAVGAERAWNGRERGTATAAARSWRNSLDGHRAWLAMDRQRREAYHQARRAWWANGAQGDPPARPARAARLGAWLRRTWARTAVAGDWSGRFGGRFCLGFRDGWAAAREAYRGGAGWRETARTRPGGEDVKPADEAGPSGDTQPDGPATEPRPQMPNEDPAPTPEPVATTQDTTTPDQPEPSDQPEAHEEPDMTESTATTPQAGETHLDHAILGLGSVQASITKIHELNDAVSAEKNALAAKVTSERERLGDKGTAATLQALDEADALVALMGQQISATADAATQVDDQANAAIAGLQPAVNAQDELHNAGATGELVSAATTD